MLSCSALSYTVTIGKRAYSVAAARTILNQFPIIITSSETTATYRKQLKTYLFETAFLPYIFSAVPYSNEEFYLSSFMITPNENFLRF